MVKQNFRSWCSSTCVNLSPSEGSQHAPQLAVLKARQSLKRAFKELSYHRDNVGMLDVFGGKQLSALHKLTEYKFSEDDNEHSHEMLI